MDTADRWKVAALAAVALLGAAWLVDLLLLSHYRHQDYTGDCGPGAASVKVDLIGGYEGSSNERGAPYYMRLILRGDDARALVGPRLVSARTGRSLELPDMARGEVPGAYEGEIPTVWLSRDFSIPYEHHLFAGTLEAAGGRPTLALVCRLVPTPTEEWRVPVLDMLMSV